MSPRELLFLATGIVGTAALFAVYSWQHSPRAPLPPPVAVAAASPAAQSTKIPSVADETAKLAARLEKSGGRPADWQLLGQSYDFLGRKDEAAAAYAHAGGRPAGATPGTRLTGTVELAPQLRSKLPADATLFVLARSAVLTGPPLAAIKLPAKNWPVKFVLDDSNAMFPSLRLSGAEKIMVEARVSASGNPIAQAGDLSGSVRNIDPQKAPPLRIVIDHSVR